MPSQARARWDYSRRSSVVGCEPCCHSGGRCADAPHDPVSERLSACRPRLGERVARASARSGEKQRSSAVGPVCDAAGRPIDGCARIEPDGRLAVFAAIQENIGQCVSNLARAGEHVPMPAVTPYPAASLALDWAHIALRGPHALGGQPSGDGPRGSKSYCCETNHLLIWAVLASRRVTRLDWAEVAASSHLARVPTLACRKP